MKKLPPGEETLPIAQVGSKFLKSDELEALKLVSLVVIESEITDALLIERYRQRMAQGRTGTVNQVGSQSYAPQQILAHMIKGDEKGKEFLLAERKFLEAELEVINGTV